MSGDRRGVGWGIFDIGDPVVPTIVRDAIAAAREARGYLKASTETWEQVRAVSVPAPERRPWGPNMPWLMGSVSMMVDEGVPLGVIEVSARYPDAMEAP